MAKLKKENLLEGWRIILKYLKPHKQAVFVLTILSTISSLTNAIVPYLAGGIIDSIIKNKTAHFFKFGIIPLAFLFLGIWFLMRIIGDTINWQINLKSSKLAAKLESSYTLEGYVKLIELPLSFHKTNKMGEIASRISRAASWLFNLINDVIINLAPQVLSIVFALMFTFSIQPMLALILVSGALIYFLILLILAPKFSEFSHAAHKAFSLAYGEAYDAVLNVASVKQATAEKFERKKLFRSFELRAYKIWLRSNRIFGTLDAWQKILVTLVQFIIFAVSVVLIHANKLTVGQLVMFNGYAAIFFGPFVTLGHNWNTIQNGLAAIEISEKTISEEPEKYVPENSVIISDFNGKVEFRNLNFSYNKKQGEVLKNISFCISPGESVALVGESGVGKSTLVDLISYYFKPTSGKILIDGHNVKNFDLKFLRSQIAVVPQEIMLFNDTVKNNIRYGSFEASDKNVELAAKLAHADEFIEKFPKKYQQMVGERGIKLSMGQKQRIALARAFLRNPKILILDEPTSALDAKSERYIQESFKELMLGRTTFIIAHRLSTVREVDRIFVIDNGMIAEEGTHEKLLGKKNGIYRKLYELQVGFS